MVLSNISTPHWWQQSCILRAADAHGVNHLVPLLTFTFVPVIQVICFYAKS